MPAARRPPRFLADDDVAARALRLETGSDVQGVEAVGIGIENREQRVRAAERILKRYKRFETRTLAVRG